MKRKTAALYDPFLDTMGGGEKHILSILQVLEQIDYEINIFWNENLSKPIKKNLNLSFNNLNFLPNIFYKASSYEKVRQLKKFDLFFYVTDGSYFFSSAKKTIIFCMVPNKSLYNMTLINKAKTFNTKFIANSAYTQKWLQKWGIKSEVIYPYVTNDFLENRPELKKEKIILSVGRFFGHLHTKKHQEIIKTFLKFHKNYPDFKLVLIGGLKDEDKTYFESLVKLAKNNKNIMLKPNVSYPELLEYYKKSMFFWHFTGYGVNEKEHPEMVEHLGMTPLEAMASGTIPFCFNAGGPKEIITHGVNGFLFNSKEELIQKTKELLAKNKVQMIIRNNGKEYAKKHFSFGVFETKVKQILL